MKKIKFSKYNRTRRERFQIRTCIVEEDEKQYVEKTALNEEAVFHVRQMKENYDRLTKQGGIPCVTAHLSQDGRTVRFPFLLGETMAKRLGRGIVAGKPPYEEIGEAMEQVLGTGKEAKKPFLRTEELTAVFGSCEGVGADEAFLASNVDCLFENVVLTAKGPCCLDYEWVFSFPVPLSFIRYRMLYYFYEQYRSILAELTLAEFLVNFGIRPEFIPVYGEMERCFQEYVHGENQQIYLSNYMHDVHVIPEDMEEVKRAVEKQREWVRQLHLEIEEKDLTIRKQIELKRLTDNHVTNLEMLVEKLRSDIGVLAQTVAVLNRHEAVVFKVKRKLGEKYNEAFPKGTRKRKLLGYGKNVFCHPLKSYRLFTTSEGRNLIEGDFKIGEGYLAQGKLKFREEREPLVSIVIPVYNQIDYTYLCLASILTHTTDVSYEIIIGDDVSADATMELSKFTENVVIHRNESNQGFLLNCNQAALAARGKYLMFLNNDTQVTDGWLKSLVDLMESDISIGMTGSKLVYPDGRLQEAGGIIWSDGSGWNYGRLDDPDKPEYNYVKDVDYMSGAAILLPRALWKEIGGFDERFAPAYCEDSDLAFQVRKAGYRVVYQPLSKVVHFEGISNGTDVNGSGLKRYQEENSLKLKEKWEKELKNQCVNDGNPNPFRARERSQGKEILLVVDHYVPTYDRDAGSKTTFQYLKMFLEKGYVIKFLGDNFLHEEPYSTVLQQMGIEILYGRDYQAKIWDWLKENGNDIKAAYLNRPHIAEKYVDFLQEHTSMKIIYYGHDLHFLREMREYQLTGDESKRDASDYWKAMELRIMKKAAVTYYPSCVERDAIHMIDPAIRVKAIIAYVFERFLTTIPDDFEGREGLLFVGGFAHPPNADAVLWFAREIFPMVRETLSIPFYIVGSKVTEEIKALEQPDNGIVVKGYVSEEELSALYHSCRMVVVPLRYGAGVKGKVIEALYYGVPVVTTGIGAEGIDGGEMVMVIQDEPEAFANEVLGLYRDLERLKVMSRETQAYVKRHYSVDAAWSVVEEDF